MIAILRTSWRVAGIGTGACLLGPAPGCKVAPLALGLAMARSAAMARNGILGIGLLAVFILLGCGDSGSGATGTGAAAAGGRGGGGNGGPSAGATGTGGPGGGGDLGGTGGSGAQPG